MATAESGKRNWFARLREGLERTRQALVQPLTDLVRRGRIDESVFDELEAALLQADVGLATTEALISELRDTLRKQGISEPAAIPGLLRDLMRARLEIPGGRLVRSEQPPTVYLFVGVNGTGKTSSIGKLAVNLREEGFNVLLGAADTFRAAAREQLAAWAERSGADLVHHQEGGDPAAVAYDAIRAARSRGADYVLIDTAGRLQTRTNLMQELQKVYRVVERELGRPADEVLLVLDATTGQNGLSQARVFREAVGVTGIVLTKLDGTAKGGVVLAIASELKLPVKLVGVGEGLHDLRPFSAEAFVQALIPDELVGEKTVSMNDP
ncbi:MAG: signal recognition particle-docking protein FtsY [Limnochordales bacterium]|nr:signal recognition particle-docking protein FtsY [Limnochordales bacterium]